MTEILKTLLLLSASGSVLGLALTLARRVCGRRLPSTLWYFAWLPVLLRLALPLPGLIPVAQAAGASASMPSIESSETRSYRYDGFTVYAAPDGAGQTADAPAVEAVPQTETVGKTAETPSAQPRLRPEAILKSPGFWLWIWLIGAALSFARYTAGYVRFRRVLMGTLQTTDGQTARVYRELAPARRPRLFCSPYVKTPMLLGLCRPLIVLPQGEISADAARNILRHELTHYRRGDLYVKWFFVLAASLHWFNPLMPLFRRELDRVCELSCDENVLARMEPSKRRSYGETLLDLASNRTLPAGVVATTFATEKRALKERLEQIMKFNYKPRAILALTIAALLLMCTAALAAGPARASAAPSADSPEPAPSNDSALASDELYTAEVSDVDGLLAAIAPDTMILLSPGTYDLSMASDYGQETDSEYYRWEEVYDGYELVIRNVTDLHIAGTEDDTVISAVPRYADVLSFADCGNITLTGFTMGHTKEQGSCAGGVVHLMGTDGVTIDDCSLYGCGVLGVQAENCWNILVTDSDIYECSDGAVELSSCRSVQFDNCDFRDCYDHHSEEPSAAFTMFRIQSCYGVAITDSRVYGNYAMEYVVSYYSQEVYLLGTLFENNKLDAEYDWYSGAVLSVEGDPIVVAGCEFRDDFPIFADGEATVAADMDGNPRSYDDLANMKQEHVDFACFAEMETPELQRTQGADGKWEVRVSTVDEFLAAIAPDTTVYLDEGLYDLSEASNYGSYGGQYYYWIDLFDGPGLVISGVENFSIIGADKETTRIEALPRYAAVLRFDDCSNIAVHGVTAGHTLGAGSCSGAVLEYRYCDGIDVRGCGLFGCGVLGVEAMESTGITVEDNEIYECSSGAVHLSRCIDAEFTGNAIHDCAWPTYSFYECLNVTVDGEAIEETPLDSLDPDLTSYTVQEANESGSTILMEITERGSAIFNETIDIPGAGPYKSAAASN